MVNKKKALLPVTLCTIFLLTLFISSPVKRSTTKTKSSHIHHIIHDDHIRIACSGTLYPDLCVSTIATFPDMKCKSLPDIISSTINHTLAEVKKTHSESRKYENRLIRNRQLLDPRDHRAIDDCVELLDQTVTELKTSFLDVLSKKHIPDAQAFLSAAMTNQYTCLDGLADSKKQSIRNHFKGTLSNITRHVSNSLAMVSKLPGAENPPSSSSSSNVVYAMREDGFPRWMNVKDRKLLQSTSSGGTNNVKYDVIVAKDGSGNFTTINEAVDIAPNSSSTRFVIYIKAGAYYEYVDVVKKKINIMFVGDGIGKTLIKGNRSVVDGWTTFRSSTLAVVGTGFIAKGITVENYAGGIKHQAVALRSGSDLSAFYNCSFIGYQDTLYVHSLRQFYRDCDIYGTVDFVFGNAAVVFQKCNLYARRPLDNQKNMFTAQGREDPFQTTGISIIESKIAPASDLIPVQSSFKSYLGRPWKEYSRTVIMRCNILDVIEPVGWHEWNGDFALSTLYYGEYLNRGAGANTTRRVTWPGFKVITNATEAAQFTAGQFIQGAEWLDAAGIPYYLNMTA
ncbi:unnamed protein product [Rhodiola kirilowii]